MGPERLVDELVIHKCHPCPVDGHLTLKHLGMGNPPEM